jgi:hypothetical protein
LRTWPPSIITSRPPRAASTSAADTELVTTNDTQAGSREHRRPVVVPASTITVRPSRRGSMLIARRAMASFSSGKLVSRLSMGRLRERSFSAGHRTPVHAAQQPRPDSASRSRRIVSG